MGGNHGQPAPAVVLFDIDGTLLRRAGPHHRRALEEAVRRVTGLEVTTDSIPVQGMLDRDILRAMLQGAGAGAGRIWRALPVLMKTAQSVYVRDCPADLRRRVCPGARSLLWRLHRRGVPLGLVTGNLSRIGWKKMERAGLKCYFRFGAFAEYAKDRVGLLRIALRQASRAGWIGGQTRLWLVGDHPNDILAARANKVRSLAVATGLSSAEELAAHKPDLLVTNLAAVKLEMLLG